MNLTVVIDTDTSAKRVKGELASMGMWVSGSATTAEGRTLMTLSPYSRVCSAEAISALSGVHDVIVPAGVFAYLGQFLGVQIDTLFVTAMLTVMGFSVHDTIVVFDMVRETISDGATSFEKAVNDSVNQTLSRSINTSLTTLVVLAAIYFLGGESVRYFSLAMMIGIVTGTYSSIFFASPLLVSWYNRQYKRS